MKKAEYLERKRRKAEIKACPRRLPSKEHMTVTINSMPMSSIQDDFFAFMAMIPLMARRRFWNPRDRSGRRRQLRGGE